MSPKLADQLMPVSDRAKMVMGVFFTFGNINLTFEMKKSRPTAEMQAALDELVAAEMIVAEERKENSKVSYRPIHDAAPYSDWLLKNSKNLPNFRVAEPIIRKAKKIKKRRA